MRELRTLKRAHGGSRVRSVQGRLSIEFGDEDEAGGDPTRVEAPARGSGFRHPARSSVNRPDRPQVGRKLPPTFHPLAYRTVVADWPVEWRERWGQRANALEELGLAWRDAETQAFVEIWHARREQGTEPTPQTASATPADE